MMQRESSRLSCHNYRRTLSNLANFGCVVSEKLIGFCQSRQDASFEMTFHSRILTSTLRNRLVFTHPR
jgi:hypothetical protein